MGRPTKYKVEYNEQAEKLCLLGATDKQLASFFDVDETTINEWKKVYPEFSQSLKDGKELADAKIAASLYHRALGYSHKEDKIFNNNGEALIVPTTKEYPPDTTAAIFWLKNRNPEQWRDKREMEHTGKDGSELIPANDMDTARRLAFILTEADKEEVKH